jgi:NAD(P)-dependent dehydrogenase (short-subunit alcohol dehydrogenase family)
LARILVTGAAGGIGQALALKLFKRGDVVFAAARQEVQTHALEQAGCRGVLMDVSDDSSVAAAFEGIGALDAVVHCAAIAPSGTLEFTTPANVAHVLNVNTLGALRVFQASLPRLRESGAGRFVFVSSLWGQASGPFVSAYAASKHAIEALADSARRELVGQGLSVSVVEPGVVRTPMFHNQGANLEQSYSELSPQEAALYGSLYEDHRKILAAAAGGAITAEQCADVILRCLDARRPRARYRAGIDAKMVVALQRALPDWAMDGLFGMVYRPRKAR